MMLSRTPPSELVADQFEQRALEMVDVINRWENETHRRLAASYIAGCLAYEYERGYGVGKSDGIAWKPTYFKK